MTQTAVTSESFANDVVTLDRRRADRREEREAGEATATPNLRKAPRRRQIDPTTCERDYSEQEIEFMQAMDAYKRAAGRMFPTCSEVLEVIRSLGYVQLNSQEQELLGITLEPFEPQGATDDASDLQDEDDEESFA